MVKIEIDYKKCKNPGPLPGQCGVCLQTCPTAVFALLSLEDREKMDKPTEIKRWKCAPIFVDMCGMCAACQKVCPKGAIKLSP